MKPLQRAFLAAACRIQFNPVDQQSIIGDADASERRAYNKPN
jgi:hypothetical protein